MVSRKKSNKLPVPACEGGYTEAQVREIMGDRLPEFQKWMAGQTMMLCEGRRYNHELKQYESACGGVAHGGITYEYDLKRFLGLLGAYHQGVWD